MDAQFKAQEKALRGLAKANPNGGGGGSRNGGGGYRRRNNTLKYCWSHGACAHDSRSCRNKKDGHVDHATFQNKYGGSTKFCNPQE